MSFDIGDSVADGSDLLGIIVGDRGGERFLKLRDELEGAEAVEAKVVEEAMGFENVGAAFRQHKLEALDFSNGADE
jgi:hypothetical protein